jgi:two-component sensor histidine kinase/PAS domain-containing protein
MRAHLLALLLGVLIPVIAFAGFAVFRFAESERERLEVRAEQVAGEVAVSLDRGFTDMLGAARVLAASDSLRNGDLAGFHARAVEAKQTIGATAIGLRDADSRQILNSNVAWGQAPPALTRLGLEDRRAAETGQPIFSNLHVGLTDGRAQFAIVLPLPSDGGPDAPHFMNLSLPVERVQRVLEREVSLEPGMIAVVIDRNGTFVAHSANPRARIGQPSLNVAAETGQRSGTMHGPGPDGRLHFVAYRWSEVADWRVSVAIPQQVLDAPLREALQLFGLLGAAALVLAVLSALLVSRRLTTAVRALTAASEALGAGRAPELSPTGLREAEEVGASLARAAEELRLREARRVATAEALRASDERFRVALLAAPIIAYTCDRELRYTWITNTHRDFNASEVLGRRDDELRGHAATLNEVAALMTLKREVIETGRPARRDLTWSQLDGTIAHFDIMAEPLRNPETAEVVGATVAALDITARVHTMQALQEQEARQRLLIGELNHRVKNMLAVVLSITSQTLRASVDLGEAGERLQDRLLALSAAHDVLTRQSWEGAALTEVLENAVAPHRPPEPGRLRLSGPPVWLVPRLALTFSLAAHELATNAAKHGALRPGSAGRVDVTWTLDHARRLRLRWQESGGPLVAEPARRGFGTRLIERGLAQDLRGQVRLDFAPEGLVCTVEATLPAPEDPLTGSAARSAAEARAYHSP